VNDTLLRCGAKLAARAQKWKYTVDERQAMENVAGMFLGAWPRTEKQPRAHRPRSLGLRGKLRNRPLSVRDVFMSADL